MPCKVQSSVSIIPTRMLRWTSRAAADPMTLVFASISALFTTPTCASMAADRGIRVGDDRRVVRDPVAHDAGLARHTGGLLLPDFQHSASAMHGSHGAPPFMSRPRMPEAAVAIPLSAASLPRRKTLNATAMPTLAGSLSRGSSRVCSPAISSTCHPWRPAGERSAYRCLHTGTACRSWAYIQKMLVGLGPTYRKCLSVRHLHRRALVDQEHVCSHGRRACSHSRHACSHGRRACSHGRRACSHGRRTCSHGRRACSHGHRTCSHGHRTCSHGHHTCSHGHRTCSHGCRACSHDRRACSHDRRACSHDRRACSHDRRACSHDRRACSHDRPTCSHGHPTCSHGHPTCSHGHHACSHGHRACSHDHHACSHGRRACSHGRRACFHEYRACPPPQPPSVVERSRARARTLRHGRGSTAWPRTTLGQCPRRPGGERIARRGCAA